MKAKKSVDELSVEDLQALLYQKKRAQRLRRLQRLRDNGRVVDLAGLPPPSPEPSALARPKAQPTGALRHYKLTLNGQDPDAAQADERESTGTGKQRWVLNKLLLLVEIGAIVGLVAILFNLWNTGQELNEELAEIQKAEVQNIALPTPTATPVIDVVVLPSGHKPPVDGRPPEQGEAGNIPAHLLPVINDYVPPPMPTPGPEQARRLQIPAINVDNTIVQGDDWGQLKKGVGQHIGSAAPGQVGNLVLSAHNDIYGEIFRHLDKLAPGDEIIVSTERSRYTYVVRDIEVVEPTDVWVMAPTEHASATLISCYPYRVNTQRIVIFADLANKTASG